MKVKLFSIILFVFISTSIFAQTNIDKWVALNDLQLIVTQTFQPAEKGNLEPLKSRSEELMSKANDLLQLDIPEEFRTKEILTLAEILQTKTKTLHALVVAIASDEEIAKSIIEIDSIFHQIIGLCTEIKK